MSQERRSRTRVPIKFDASISQSGHEIKVKSWDISLRGMQCSSDTAFKKDTACRIAITLSPEVTIKIDGRIIRTTENTTAVFFSNMEEESFHHLKSLLQYNTDRPDIIENELMQPVKPPED